MLNKTAYKKSLLLSSYILAIVSVGFSQFSRAMVPLYCPTPGLHDVDPRKSIMVTEQAVVSKAVSLHSVMKKLVTDSGVPNLTPTQLWDQWWDTQNNGPSLAQGPHCDDTVNATGQTTLNDFPLDCPRNEGNEININPFHPNSSAQYIPIALVNRLDLAPPNGANCGEYRIVFARKTGQTNGGERNLIIFEAVLDNPKPNCGLDGCRAIAKFWADLSDIQSPKMRAKKLRQFFLKGIPSSNIEPVISVENFSPGTGQIRTNQFLSGNNAQRWQLREFKLAQLQSSQGNSLALKFIPVTTKGNPWGELFNEQFNDPRTLPFMMDFIGEVSSLNQTQLDQISMSIPDNYNSGQSTAQGFFSESNYTTHFDSNGPFSNMIQTQLGILGSNLTPSDIVARAKTQSCAGCHQLSNSDNLGDGLTWPNSLGFVHITEDATQIVNGTDHFSISDALENHFLPIRETIFENYLDNSCMPCLTPVLISKDDFLVNNNGSYNDTDVDVLPEKKSVSLGLSLIDPDKLLSSKNSAFLRAEKNRQQGSVGLDSMTNENIDLNLDSTDDTTQANNNTAITVEVSADGKHFIIPSSKTIMELDQARKAHLPKVNIGGTSRVH